MRLLILSALFQTALSNIRGFNFYGLETPLQNFVCSWQYPFEHYVDFLSENGFNSIRIPFSYDYIQKGDFTYMDRMVEYTSKKNITILLDFHRVSQDYQSSNPFLDISITQFVEGWNVVLERYVKNRWVFGIGLFNEYQGTDPHYWSDMMGQVIDKIEQSQPLNRWIYFVGGTLWGGNLHNISLEDKPYKERIKYEIHKYSFSGTSTLEDWENSFGSFYNKIVIGEWSVSNTDWDDRFIDFCHSKNIRDNYYWVISNSWDTSNIWKDNCVDINYNVLEKIKKMWYE